MRKSFGLVVGVALALALSAATATSASAFSWETSCDMFVANQTFYTIQAYNSAVNGSKEVWGPTSIAPLSGQSEFQVQSVYPLHNHCSIDLWWELQTPDGSGWSQALETYIYDPNSGHNNGFGTATGDLAQRACVQTTVTDDGSDEDVAVILWNTCPGGNASRYHPAGLSPSLGGDPQRLAGDATRRPSEPRHVPSLLHRADLPGRGWGQATRVVHLGRLGRILSAAKVPASCRDKESDNSLPSPLKEGGAAFFRRGGLQFTSAGEGIYANTRQARRTINDAVSTHSIGCLARLLTSTRFHTSVSTKRTGVTVAGRRLIVSRLKVSTHSGARTTRTDYIDVIGMQRGTANALMMFANDQRHPDAREEAVAIGAVAGRLP